MELYHRMRPITPDRRSNTATLTSSSRYTTSLVGPQPTASTPWTRRCQSMASIAARLNQLFRPSSRLSRQLLAENPRGLQAARGYEIIFPSLELHASSPSSYPRCIAPIDGSRVAYPIIREPRRPSCLAWRFHYVRIVGRHAAIVGRRPEGSIQRRRQPLACRMIPPPGC